MMSMQFSKQLSLVILTSIFIGLAFVIVTRDVTVVAPHFVSAIIAKQCVCVLSYTNITANNTVLKIDEFFSDYYTSMSFVPNFAAEQINNTTLISKCEYQECADFRIEYQIHDKQNASIITTLPVKDFSPIYLSKGEIWNHQPLLTQNYTARQLGGLKIIFGEDFAS